MSMTAAMKNQQSLIQAIAETDATLLLIPSTKIQAWINKYPHFNLLFYQQYEQRYEDLLTTVHHLLFDKLDKRIMQYLEEKAEALGMKTIKISHRQIALELGTAREVVTRIMKKLEKENLIHQLPDSKLEIC
jgi:CRP/FNR family transcriptional regulator